MSVSTLLRPPLVWLVMAEAALIAVVGGVSWHIWQERIAPTNAPVASGPPAFPAPRPHTGGSPALAAPSPTPTVPAAPRPQVGPTPGFRTDSGFMAREMAELNRVEAAFEDLEWRLTKAIVDGIQRYLEGVVLPSIERSQGGQR